MLYRWAFDADKKRENEKRCLVCGLENGGDLVRILRIQSCDYNHILIKIRWGSEWSSHCERFAGHSLARRGLLFDWWRFSIVLVDLDSKQWSCWESKRAVDEHPLGDSQCHRDVTRRTRLIQRSPPLSHSAVSPAACDAVYRAMCLLFMCVFWR